MPCDFCIKWSQTNSRIWATSTGEVNPTQVKVNDLVDKARSTADAAQKKQAILDAQHLLYFEDYPSIPLGYATAIQPIYNYVHGHFIAAGSYEGLNNEYTWLDKH